MNSTVKLLALDLDDTLLNTELEISPENRRAVLAAEEAGVRVLLASGRVPEAMQRYARDLGMERRPGYLISNNGCTIIRSDNKELLYRKALSSETALTIYQSAAGAGFPCEIYRRNSICTDRDNAWTDHDCYLSGLTKQILEDFSGEIEADPPIKMVIPGEPEAVEQLEQRLKAQYGKQCSIFRSKPYFLEILPRDADKGIALAHLAKQLQVDRSEVMAVGDADNDLGMIRWAGIGAAMANANSSVLAIANCRSRKSHQEHGVAELIHRFIIR